jgi:hypothetical protein
VGNEQTPILSIVPTGTVRKGVNSKSKIFDSPHYIPVSRNNLDTIDIEKGTDFIHSRRSSCQVAFKKNKLLLNYGLL